MLSFQGKHNRLIYFQMNLSNYILVCNKTIAEKVGNIECKCRSKAQNAKNHSDKTIKNWKKYIKIQENL